MKKTLKNKITSKAGLTLAEMLVALLILMMVVSVVAAGIPVAAEAYRKVTDAANGEILLSTAMTRLRDELTTATEITVGETDKALIYRNDLNNDAKIWLNSEKNGNIYVSQFLEKRADGSYIYKYENPLVSDKAASGNQYVTYTAITYENGIVTVTGLKAMQEGRTEPLGTVETFKIRVIG